MPDEWPFPPSLHPLQCPLPCSSHSVSEGGGTETPASGLSRSRLAVSGAFDLDVNQKLSLASLDISGKIAPFSVIYPVRKLTGRSTCPQAADVAECSCELWLQQLLDSCKTLSDLQRSHRLPDTLLQCSNNSSFQSGMGTSTCALSSQACSRAAGASALGRFHCRCVAKFQAWRSPLLPSPSTSTLR